ncbi:unnamed protein product [Miscanthus lutarioriparius]|uniref:Uncharacterized protein n=1 Tax=Miscanthus lutarioriparius TaxID=422564 RepID=A0A811RAJ0_9POAL|nr:unnamed protein product [Miscanthus lutarioriparius]
MWKKTSGHHRSKIPHLLLSDSPGQSGGLFPPPPSVPSSPSLVLLLVTLTLPAPSSSSAPSVVPPSVPVLPCHGEAEVVNVEPTEDPVVSASADSAVNEGHIKRVRELQEAGLSATHVVETFAKWRVVPLKNRDPAYSYKGVLDPNRESVEEVSDKEIARRVKEIIDISRPDWSGVPEPYHAENPPPQLEPGQAQVDNKLNRGPVPSEITLAPKPDVATGEEKPLGGATQGLTKSTEKPASEPAQFVGKRKTRSQEDAEEVSLPLTKRGQSKSRSPQSADEAGENQPRGAERAETENPLRTGDQVFARLDSLECVWEVCTQEKVSTPPASKPIGRRGKKLKSLVHINPVAKSPKIPSGVIAGESESGQAQGAEAMLLEKDPFRMDAIIHELQVCQSLWKEASDQAKQSGVETSRLREEVNILLTIVVALPPGFPLFEDQRRYTELLKREKAALERQVDDLQKTLTVAEQRREDVGGELTEGAMTAIGHAIGTLKSRIPDLDVSLILQGYNCGSEDDAKKLLREIQPTVKAFVDQLCFSVDDDEDE